MITVTSIYPQNFEISHSFTKITTSIPTNALINPLTLTNTLQFHSIFTKPGKMLSYNKHTLKTLARRYNNISRTYNSRSNKASSLYAKISPLGNPDVNVTQELESWVENGNKVRFAELQRIVLDLRKRNRYAQALQVSEWTRSKGIYTFTPVQHAVQLDLMGKVQGLSSAENYFDRLSGEDKTEKAYGALLHCYVRERQTEKALLHLKKMKENGLDLTTVQYNDLMCLYSSTCEYEMVPEVLKQMKSNAIQPDNLSYRICINSYGSRSDLDGVENTLYEMENDAQIVMDWNTYAVVANYYMKAGFEHKANIFLRKAEAKLDHKDATGYNHLISLHTRLRQIDDVLRLWDMEKNARKKLLNRDYVNVMESLVRLDKLEEAEKVLKEWESSGNFYDIRVPSLVIIGYIEKGLCQKAEALLEGLMEASKELTFNLWCRLAVGYLERGVIEKALELLKLAFSVRQKIKFEEKVIMKALSLVGERGSFDDAEKVLSLLKFVMPLKREMYHVLLKSYVCGGDEVNRHKLLDAMKAYGFEEDEETLKILSLKHSKA